MNDRAERFELRLTSSEAGMLKALAKDAGLSAADLFRQLLRKRWDEVMTATNHAKMERLAFGSLTDMAGRQGVSCAAAFCSEPGHRYMPLRRPDNGPQPLMSNVLEAPMLGNIVTQGFAMVLTEADRQLVEARFPGQTATWLFAS
jgi:hypothetical protein